MGRYLNIGTCIALLSNLHSAEEYYPPPSPVDIPTFLEHNPEIKKLLEDHPELLPVIHARAITPKWTGIPLKNKWAGVPQLEKLYEAHPTAFVQTQEVRKDGGHAHYVSCIDLRSPLCHAVQAGLLELVNFILEKEDESKKKPNKEKKQIDFSKEKTTQCANPLHLVSRCTDPDIRSQIAAALLKKDATLAEQRDNWEKTPLTYAREAGWDTELAELIENVKKEPKEKKSPRKKSLLARALVNSPRSRRRPSIHSRPQWLRIRSRKEAPRSNGDDDDGAPGGAS